MNNAKNADNNGRGRIEIEFNDDDENDDEVVKEAGDDNDDIQNDGEDDGC